MLDAFHFCLNSDGESSPTQYTASNCMSSLTIVILNIDYGSWDILHHCSGIIGSKECSKALRVFNYVIISDENSNTVFGIHQTQNYS